MAEVKYCLFIPTYNVAPVVGQVLNSIDDDLIARSEAVLCVDNGSMDGTVELIRRFAAGHAFRAKFKIMSNERNYFLGGSTIVAIDRARSMGCDYLLNLHSDGQAKAADVARLLSFCDTSRGNLVLGSRFLESSDTERYALTRKLGNLFFVYLQQILLRRKVFDLGALMALPLSRLDAVNYRAIPADMAYQPLLIMELIRAQRDLPIDEIPIHWGAAEHSNVNPWSYGLVHSARCLRFAFGASFYTAAPPRLISTEISIREYESVPAEQRGRPV